MVPYIPTPTMIEATSASTTVRYRNRLTGITGFSARCSTRTASRPSSRLPITIAAVCQDSQAKDCPATVTQTSSRLTLAAIRVAPR